jgi:hypothetical protein
LAVKASPLYAENGFHVDYFEATALIVVYMFVASYLELK